MATCSMWTTPVTAPMETVVLAGHSGGATIGVLVLVGQDDGVDAQATVLLSCAGIYLAL
jgi:hypothetical protein